MNVHRTWCRTSRPCRRAIRRTTNDPDCPSARAADGNSPTASCRDGDCARFCIDLLQMYLAREIQQIRVVVRIPCIHTVRRVRLALGPVLEGKFPGLEFSGGWQSKRVTIGFFCAVDPQFCRRLFQLHRRDHRLLALVVSCNSFREQQNPTSRSLRPNRAARAWFNPSSAEPDIAIPVRIRYRDCRWYNRAGVAADSAFLHHLWPVLGSRRERIFSPKSDTQTNPSSPFTIIIGWLAAAFPRQAVGGDDHMRSCPFGRGVALF